MLVGPCRKTRDSPLGWALRRRTRAYMQSICVPSERGMEYICTRRHLCRTAARRSGPLCDACPPGCGWSGTMATHPQGAPCSTSSICWSAPFSWADACSTPSPASIY